MKKGSAKHCLGSRLHRSRTALIPKKAADRIKSHRGDTVTMARLFHAGELTSVWAPDANHEAV
jgi:transposase